MFMVYGILRNLLLHATYHCLSILYNEVGNGLISDPAFANYKQMNAVNMLYCMSNIVHAYKVSLE